LSRFVQYVELDLSPWKGTRPVELTGHTDFPIVGELPYLLTLGGHAFYWFSLEIPERSEAAESEANYRPALLSARNLESLLGGPERRTFSAVPSA